MESIENGSMVFYERIDNKTFNITSLYFIASKEVIKDKKFDYCDAGAAAVCIEFPADNPIAECSTVMISPMYYGSFGEWNILKLEYDVITKLIQIGLNDKKHNILCRFGTKLCEHISGNLKKFLCRFGTERNLNGTIYCDNE